MADVSKSADQSMEEILQSIKRIIAEEGDEDTAAPATDDVLELTEAVETPDDDVEVDEANDGDDTMAVDALLDSLAEGESDGPSEDIESDPAELEAMYAGSASEEEEDAAEETAEPEMQAAPEPEPEPEAEEAAEDDASTLIDDVTAAASASALKQLISPEPTRQSDGLAFRSGLHVEDLVIEAMRPMLKEWLDKNLPDLVEELVQREIRKITASLQ